MTLSLALPLEDQCVRLVGRSALSAETLASLDDVREAVRDPYFHLGWVRLLDAGFQAHPDVYRTWVPTRVERAFDQASRHRRHVASGSPARRGGLADRGGGGDGRPAQSGFEVLGCRGLLHADETDHANPVSSLVAPPLRLRGTTIARVDAGGEVC